MSKAKDLRDAAGALAHLQALRASLLTKGYDLDAQLVAHCGEVLGGVLGRIATDRMHPLDEVCPMTEPS